MSLIRPSLRYRAFFRRPRPVAACAALTFAALTAATLTGCGGGGGADSDPGCAGECAQRALSADDVRTIIAQGVAEAERLGVAATISVVDRVGNVLAVFQMNDAAANTLITSDRAVPAAASLENRVAPTAVAAISKAGTGAYLSSQGNAFTTRTASQIVQQNFNPGELNRPGGPLFGVQFSQLPCGDLVTSFNPAPRSGPADRTGPRRLPLGLAADPGGLPLFKASTGTGLSGEVQDGSVPVGGVGVELGCPLLNVCAGPDAPGELNCRLHTDADDADAAACKPARTAAEECTAQFERLYTVDPKTLDVDTNLEEKIAVAASAGFEAPLDRRANRISVDGKFLRFVDDDRIGPVSAASCASLNGALVPIPGYTDVGDCASIEGGTILGQPESGIDEAIFEGLEAEVLVDGNGANRFPPIAGDALSQTEVRTILRNALIVAQRTRGQIRRPLGTHARVTISVVGTDGEILGIVRTRDAPVFGTDVSLQKARTAQFFSSPDARADMEAAPGLPDLAVLSLPPTPDMISRYVGRAEDFLFNRALFAGNTIDPRDVLTGAVAFADRSGGNLSRPFFPDGIIGTDNGPFSRPLEEWSPFATGLQLDLVFLKVAQSTCLGEAHSSCTDIEKLPNGIQIFPGSVPIYRGSTLVGGIGVSGDGIDQDDMISFLGVHNAGLELNGSIGNAPREMRADNISVDGAHLRFVNCPTKPFIDSNEQGACDGL